MYIQRYSSINSDGTTFFTNINWVTRGGAMYLFQYNVLVVKGECVFQKNSADHAGALYIIMAKQPPQF